MSNQPKARMDPITQSVIHYGLIGAVAEMKAVVVRTAYSNLWKHAGDLSCGILTPEGEIVAQGEADIPVHLSSMPYSLRGILSKIDPGLLRPGDVLLQNDPYQGNNHLPDLIMVRPIFYKGGLVAYAAVRGHYVDVGGMGPGSYSVLTDDIYAEGLRIPPVRIFKAGKLDRDVLEMLLANMRNPRERLGDFHSQMAGCLAGERRVHAYCGKYGPDTVMAAMASILDDAERRTRVAIAGIPDGEYRFEDFCDGVRPEDGPIKIAGKVTVRADEVEVDFSGSSDQVRGGMNAPPAVTASGVYYAIKCLTDPGAPPNSGCYRPIRIHAPLGSVVNPEFPGPVVAANIETSTRIAEVVTGALAGALPGRVAAASSGTSGALVLGADARQGNGSRRGAIMVEAHGVGHGASAASDGLNGRRVGLGNMSNTPNEVLEATFPITILRYELTRDAGGPGRCRGGTGLTREVRFDEDLTATVVADRVQVAPYGLHGGLGGGKAQFWVEIPGHERQAIHSRSAPLRLPKGTVLHFQVAGGGGYGRPEDRALECIQDDLDDGYLSPEMARKHYGVRVTRDESRPDGQWVASAPVSADSSSHEPSPC
ncbi:MAG: hydantoinase B/oxoprolinase family protein [Betaproteobacteria bacterium]|nr:MAG: hydantoinase B/oxoprolinase family protein [Betaproteobacteria bacterium]